MQPNIFSCLSFLVLRDIARFYCVRLSHACIVRDLIPIVTIDQRVRLPLSQGRGHGVGFYSWLMRVVVFQVYALF